MKFSLVSTIIGTLLLTACISVPPKDAITPNPVGQNVHGGHVVAEGEIAPAMLQEKIDKGEINVLLDVREADEYEETHIPGTTHRISVKELSAETLDAAGIKKDDNIIVYCRSGARSRVAAKLMRDLGYKNVLELNSGIIHWLEDGFPSESGTETTTLSPKISFDKLTYDFGEVPQFGGTVQTTFEIRNEGKETLSIGIITTSCACTTAKLDQSEILAGQKTTLTIMFDPNLHEEPKDKFKRTIFVPSNDPQTPEAELTITVDILENQ